jgi:chemotaxis protein CheD
VSNATGGGRAAATAATVVGLGALHATSDADAVLVTYALGSCLGVAVYDPVACVGGLLHAMMPRSDVAAERAEAQPGLFVDTGIPALFRACYALGARKERLIVRLAGAASTRDLDGDHFQIGRRNLLMARQLFWKNGVLVRAHETGGKAWRTMSLTMHDGAVTVRSADTDLRL